MKKYIIILFSVAFVHSIQAQQVISASINDIIRSAQAESPDYLLAKTKETNSYWQYVSAKSVFKPQLSLAATIPSINRSINSITLPDGTETFVNQSFMRNSIGVNLSQVISKTGGQVFVSTDLERLDLFKTNSQNAFSSYLSSPIQVGFNQPIMRFNPYEWNKKQAEIQYEASKKVFVEDKERLAFDAVNFFFDLYINELNLQEAQRNKDYLDSIAQNSEGRYSVGRISETDLLQIQLAAKNADGRVAELSLLSQNKTETLRDFLGIQDEVSFDFSTPNVITLYEVDKDMALEYAVKNRSQTENFRLRELSAERQLEEAIKENGPNLRLNGSFGLTQSAPNFVDTYQGLNDQERISLSINIPIADFGRSKAQREIAKSNLELTNLQIKQDKISFEREILVNVEQFQLKRDQLALSEEALAIAEKRLDIAKKRFNIGKIDVTNLNIAINEELSARQRYFATLWDLWRAHYTLRNLTLYDFENDMPIE